MALADACADAGGAERAERYYGRIVRELPAGAYSTRAQEWLRTRTPASEPWRCTGCHQAERPCHEPGRTQNLLGGSADDELGQRHRADSSARSEESSTQGDSVEAIAYPNRITGAKLWVW